MIDFVIYSTTSVCLFGRADNARFTGAASVDDLNKPDVTIAYFIGGGEEGWVKERFPNAKLRGVTNSGATAPVEEVMARRADAAPINRVPWVAMNKKVKGLAVLPKEENCQGTTEKAAPVGHGIDKNQPAFAEWLRAVTKPCRTRSTQTSGASSKPCEEQPARRSAPGLTERRPRWNSTSRPLSRTGASSLGGLGVTLALSGATIVASLAAGGVIGLPRVYGPAWLRPAIVFYIDTMRAIPLLVVLVWVFFAVPVLTGLSMPPFWAALIALTLHIAAYVAEIVRAGIESVRPGQMRAGLALGMSGPQVVRKIVLPQALVRMLPAFGSVLSIDDQGHRDRRGDRRARIHEALGDPRRADLQADRDLHLRDAGLFRDPVPGHAARRLRLPARRASRPLMTLDWSVVWQYRWTLFEGALVTIALTVLTMAFAIPGGILLASMRLSRIAAPRRRRAPVSSSSSATCR